MFVEAPPMSLSISVPPGTKGRLMWTVPGEGQFRSPIPLQQMFVAGKASLLDRMGATMNRFHWLLYLLAVPLYFDWLLGGRRMKEATTESTEANP